MKPAFGAIRFKVARDAARVSNSQQQTLSGRHLMTLRHERDRTFTMVPGFNIHLAAASKTAVKSIV
jgi:hypothetical protein